MKTGYHAVYEKTYFEAIDHANRNGFDFVQFDLGVPNYYLEELPGDFLLNLKDYAESRNVEMTFHSPGDNVSLYCDYPFIRKGILDHFKMILEKANTLGARHVTFHAGNHPQFKKSGMITDDYSLLHRDYYENVLYENLKELIGCSGNVLICLENHMFTGLTMNVAKRLIREGSALYLTLDTSKMYTAQNVLDDGIFQFMMAYEDRIREMHIHDRTEQGPHQIFGTGIVDFSLYREIMKRNNVYLNFEVRPLPAAKMSKDKCIEYLSAVKR